jgi:hypothetical protein
MDGTWTYTLAAAAVAFYGSLISLIERLARRGNGDCAAMTAPRVDDLAGVGCREGSLVDGVLIGFS